MTAMAMTDPHTLALAQSQMVQTTLLIQGKRSRGLWPPLGPSRRQQRHNRARTKQLKINTYLCGENGRHRPDHHHNMVRIYRGVGGWLVLLAAPTEDTRTTWKCSGIRQPQRQKLHKTVTVTLLRRTLHLSSSVSEPSVVSGRWWLSSWSPPFPLACLARISAISEAVRKRPPGPRGRRMAWRWRDSCR